MTCEHFWSKAETKGEKLPYKMETKLFSFDNMSLHKKPNLIL